MLQNVSIEKEKYLNKNKAAELKAYIQNPSSTVLQKKIADINEIVRQMATNRR